jgi:demethylmenaquinone methyltransferase/2-methoxy-6-polyprenyl-1,4-benzoquinol methylase
MMGKPHDVTVGKSLRASSVLAVKLVVWSLPIVVFVLYTVYLKYFVSTPSIDYGTGNMFDKIAPRYDFINRVLAFNMDRSWRQTMVDEIVQHVLLSVTTKDDDDDDEPTIQILDLATGTADVAIILADTLLQQQQHRSEGKTLPKFKIIGVDPSERMIVHGQSKVFHKKMENVISLYVGDSRNLAQQQQQQILPITDSSMDAITMAFGMRNVPPNDREKAFCEMYRVLKKGTGKLAILEFSEPTNNHGILGRMAKLFIRHVVPTVGALLSGASREYRHLQNSIDQFPTPTEFMESIERVRCPAGTSTTTTTTTTTHGGGTFQIDKFHEMNFGSVQLYVASPIVL